MDDVVTITDLCRELDLPQGQVGMVLRTILVESGLPYRRAGTSFLLSREVAAEILGRYRSRHARFSRHRAAAAL